jgi:tetratricopeptide (TPR) repeat protein
VRSDPANADAHANLGLTLIAAGRSDEGLAQIRQAIEQKPELWGGLTPHVWLLAAHHDPKARRSADALAFAERIVRVSTDRAGALDALAACHAALGHFDQAAQIAGAALSAAPTELLKRAIRTRIALYEKKQPFVLQP